MEKLKLYTNKTHRFGKKVLIEGIEVEFSEDGSTTVSNQDDLKVLIDNGLTREKVVEKKIQVKGEVKAVIDDSALQSIIADLKKANEDFFNENTSLKSELEETKEMNIKLENEISELKELINSLPTENEYIDNEPEPVTEVDNIEKEEIIKEVKSKKKAELIDFCKEAGLEMSEWINLNVEDLRSYVISKL